MKFQRAAVRLAGTVAIMAFALTVRAQSYNRYDTSFQPGYERGRRVDPLDRVRVDLDRAAVDIRYLSGSEFRRLEHAQHEINEFQRSWAKGYFNKGQLDDVIGSLQHVVDRNRLQPRDRDRLLDDLFRLREFRARRGRY